MARQSVVLEPAPGGPRTSTVLRAGPPHRNKGRVADVIVGIVGLAGLIFAIALFTTLPEDDAPPAQYEVTFEEGVETLELAAVAALAEGGTAELGFDIQANFVYAVELVVSWEDDIAASYGDDFNVSLIDPTGATVVAGLGLAGLEPVASGVPATYAARVTSHAVLHTLRERPTPEIITAEPGTQLFEIQAAALDAAQTNGTGSWKLVVTLDEAGDCPPPQSLDPNRALQCQAATMGGGDPGNAFELVRITFTTYQPMVQPI